MALQLMNHKKWKLCQGKKIGLIYFLYWKTTKRKTVHQALDASYKATFAPEDIRNEIPNVLWLKNGTASTTIQKTLNKFDTSCQWNKFRTYCTINLTHLVSGIKLRVIARLLLCVHHSSMHHNSFHLLSYLVLLTIADCIMLHVLHHRLRSTTMKCVINHRG